MTRFESVFSVPHLNVLFPEMNEIKYHKNIVLVQSNDVSETQLNSTWIVLEGVYIYIYIYIYVCVCACACVCIYIYIYIYRSLIYICSICYGLSFMG
jgi:hypothetical protein